VRRLAPRLFFNLHGLVALAAATAAGVASAHVSAHAATTHPWCLVVQAMDDGWACGYDSFEQCRVEARAGNTGFCTQNPGYQPPAKLTRPQKRHKDH
jgi:hypothetical protein